MLFEEIRYESIEILSFHSIDDYKLFVIYNGLEIEVSILDRIFIDHYRSGVVSLNLGSVLKVEMKILKEFDLKKSTEIQKWQVTKVISGYQLS